MVVAVHVQTPFRITSTLPAPPSRGRSVEGGTNVHVQADACAIVKAWPATVIPPLRGGPPFGATVNVTCEGPEPAVLAAVIQSALDDAVHGQPWPVEIVAPMLPPPGATS